MDASLPKTKLHISSVSHKLALRLLAWLADEPTRPLTLICAPAGFSKTIPFSEWRATDAAQDFPLTRLSLDKDDSNSTRFLIHLVAALRILKPSIGDATLSLQASRPRSLLPRAVLSSPLNSPSEFRPFALILDDYYAITATRFTKRLAIYLINCPRKCISSSSPVPVRQGLVRDGAPVTQLSNCVPMSCAF